MSTTQDAIDFIAKKGSARTDEIAQHVGKDNSYVAAMLSHHVHGGKLVTCKVIGANGQSCNEYRISASGRPNNFREYEKPKSALGVRIDAHATADQREKDWPKPPKVHPTATKPEAQSRGAYESALEPLRAKRAELGEELRKIDAAITAIEALA
jgi:hypothetical protein